VKPPCKDCPERNELCHATCEKYKAYRAEREALYEDRHQRWERRHEVSEQMLKRAQAKKRKKQ